ncbi:MAG: HEAT repeat domain-containing protein [Candidatus Omnitrophica bacterium]|nr:HEAT repeat domain-containing protein [Candidatus Omnitrophota bacterium]
MFRASRGFSGLTILSLVFLNLALPISVFPADSEKPSVNLEEAAPLNKFRSVENRLSDLEKLARTNKAKGEEVAMFILRDDGDNAAMRMRAGEFFAQNGEQNLEKLREFFYSRTESNLTRTYIFYALEGSNGISLDETKSLALDFNEDIAIRSKALLLFDKISGEGGIDVLAKFASSKAQPPDLRLSAIGCLGKYSGNDRVNRAIAKIVRDRTEEPDIKTFAIAVALSLGLTDLVPDLLKITADGFEVQNVRLAALTAIENMGNSSIIPQLEAIANNCSDSEVFLRKSVCGTIARLREGKES